MIGMTDHEKRLAIINGLIAAAAEFARNTEIPLPDHVEIHYCVQAADDAASHAGVDRIARLVRETPHGERGYYETRHDFSPSVSYRAVSVDTAQMDRWNALTSYTGSVTPETRTAA